MAYIPVGTVAIVTKTSGYTVTVNDYFVRGDTTSGAFIFTLPTAVGIQGKEFIIKNLGTSNLTIDGNGSETIDGALTKVLSNKYASINIISDGANWSII